MAKKITTNRNRPSHHSQRGLTFIESEDAAIDNLGDKWKRDMINEINSIQKIIWLTGNMYSFSFDNDWRAYCEVPESTDIKASSFDKSHFDVLVALIQSRQLIETHFGEKCTISKEWQIYTWWKFSSKWIHWDLCHYHHLSWPWFSDDDRTKYDDRFYILKDMLSLVNDVLDETKKQISCTL